jgi:hypothetical protein
MNFLGHRKCSVHDSRIVTFRVEYTVSSVFGISYYLHQRVPKRQRQTTYKARRTYRPLVNRMIGGPSLCHYGQRYPHRGAGETRDSSFKDPLVNSGVRCLTDARGFRPSTDDRCIRLRDSDHGRVDMRRREVVGIDRIVLIGVEQQSIMARGVRSMPRWRMQDR